MPGLGLESKSDSSSGPVLAASLGAPAHSSSRATRPRDRLSPFGFAEASQSGAPPSPSSLVSSGQVRGPPSPTTKPAGVIRGSSAHNPLRFALSSTVPSIAGLGLRELTSPQGSSVTIDRQPQRCAVSAGWDLPSAAVAPR